MANELAGVEAKVEENATVIGSAVVLLEQLSQLLKDAKDDPVQVQRIIDSIDAQKNALAAAVAANTPAEEV